MGLLPRDLDILPPSDDRVFKLILTDEKWTPGLINLISLLLCLPYTLDYMNSFSMRRDMTNELLSDAIHAILVLTSGGMIYDLKNLHH